MLTEKAKDVTMEVRQNLGIVQKGYSVDMADLMEFIEARRPNGMNKGTFIQQLGITDSAFRYYVNNQRQLGVSSLRTIARYFIAHQDTEALSKLASYAIDIDGDFTPSD